MKFSVLLCLYGDDNFDHFVDCYHSIINQQEGTFDEIVIVVEGSVDDRFYSFFKEHYDITVYYLEKVNGPFNFGFPSALNFGIQRSNGEYIVRMDPDDLCSPIRLKEIDQFITTYPDIDLFGSHVGEYDEELGNRLGIRKVPISQDSIRKVLKYRSPFNHPAVVFKRSSALLIGGYPQVPSNEDYCFWATFIKLGYAVGNIDKILVNMRTGDNLILRRSSRKYRKFEKYSMRYLWSLGVFSWYEFYILSSLRYLVRSLPKGGVKIMYNLIRK